MSLEFFHIPCKMRKTLDWCIRTHWVLSTWQWNTKLYSWTRTREKKNGNRARIYQEINDVNKVRYIFIFIDVEHMTTNPSVELNSWKYAFGNETTWNSNATVKVNQWKKRKDWMCAFELFGFCFIDFVIWMLFRMFSFKEICLHFVNKFE